MKTKSYFLLCFLIMWSSSIFSQKFSSDFYDKKYDISNDFNSAILTKSGYLVLNSDMKGGAWGIGVKKITTLLLFNDKMEIIKDVKVELKGGKSSRIKGFYKAGGKLILVYGYFDDKKDKQFVVSAIQINESDISIGPEKELATFVTESKKDYFYFSLNYSTDSTKYLLFKEPELKNNEMKQFYFGVFNSDLIKQYDKEVKLNFDYGHAVVDTKILDEKGNVFVEIKYFDQELKDREYPGNEENSSLKYTTEITSYAAGTQQSNKIDINLNGKKQHISKIVYNNKSKLIEIAGTYMNDDKSGVSGVYACTYDPASRTTSKVNISEIPSEIVGLFQKENIATVGKDNAGISGLFRNQSLKYRNNGTIDFTLEYNNRIVRKVMYNQVPQMYTQFFCKSILNININADGKMVFTRIPKDQTSTYSNYYISYSSFYAGNKLIFIYNDAKDNIVGNVNGVPQTIGDMRRSVCAGAVIDENGNLERKIIYDQSEDNYITISMISGSMDNNSIFLQKRKTGSTMAIEHTKIGVVRVE